MLLKRALINSQIVSLLIAGVAGRRDAAAMGRIRCRKGQREIHTHGFQFGFDVDSAAS